GEQLIRMLAHTNRWVRQTALRLLADRHDQSLALTLKQLISESRGQLALEAFWALNLCGGVTEDVSLRLLEHPEPQVRLGTGRLLGDGQFVPRELAKSLAVMASREPNIEGRAQLACSARRLPAEDALPILAGLLRHDADATDSRMPLLCWWALEAKCDANRDAVVKLFEDSPFWSQAMVEQHLLERLMRRYAAAGTRKDLLICARLLQL